MLIMISIIISTCGTLLINLLLGNFSAFFYAADATKWLISGLIFCGFLMSSLILGFKWNKGHCTKGEMIKIGIGLFLVGGLLLPVFTLLPAKILVEISALFNIGIHPFFAIVFFTVAFIILIFIDYKKE